MQWLQTTRNGRGVLAIAALLAVGAAGAQQADPPAPPLAVETAAPDEGDDAPPLAAVRLARDRLVGIRDFQAALNPAQAAVTAQAEQRDPGYALDLAALARIQAELRDIDDAESNYLAAVELVADAEGEYSVTLIDIYRGLGRAYIRGARYPEAITTLEQAQHISQRNLGLFNVEQSPLLDDITTAYLGLGNTGDARELQLQRLENAVRRFGADDARVIPFRYTLANYYERSRLPVSAQEQYSLVLQTQDTALGTMAPELIGPVRQLAKLDLLLTQGETIEHRDRLATLLQQNPDSDPLERGLALAQLGDWATVAGDTPTAHDYYRRAWQTLLARDDVDVADYFGKPAMIDFIAPLNAVDRGDRSDPYAWAQVVLEFDVSAAGLPSNVKIVDSATGPLQQRYVRRVRETHFRPRLVDGQAVATTNVRATQLFRYYVDEDDDEAADEDR
jgi:tetratricopeptide (TPR) repeat protein